MKSLLIILFTVLIVANTHAEKLWVQSKPPKQTNEGVNMLMCLDSNNCFAIGDMNDRIILYNSTNQGQSWSEVFEKYDNQNTEIVNVFNCFMTNTNNIYITYTDRVALELSNDGGKSFRTILFGDLSENEIDLFFDITFYKDYISAGITRNALVYTSDNWETNSIVTIPDSITSNDPIYFIDSNNIVFSRVDDHNTDFIKYDIVNKDWTIWSRGSLVEDKYEDFNYLQFVNDTLGYGCGGKLNGIGGQSNDIIWKTTDKGRTWIKLMNQLNYPGFGMRQLSFRNELHGIAVGSWGKIFETTDGGESWFQYPVREEMASLGTRITWAGSVALFTTWNKGIFCLETITNVEELSSDEKFRIFQSGHNLEIAINDESHAIYRFSLYNSSGQSLVTRMIRSSFGFVFEPVELIDLTNGVYYYTISKNNDVEFTGKLVVVE
jgi:hypothetical protein